MRQFGFSFKKNKMDKLQDMEVQAQLNIWQKQGILDRFVLSGPPVGMKQKKGAINNGAYPPYFQRFWGLLPVKICKPQTMHELDAAIARGYTLEYIEAAIDGYAKDEERRSKTKDYQKHSPHRWLKNDRFLDEQSHDPAVALRSKADITVGPLERSLGIKIVGQERRMVLDILDDVTIGQLIKFKESYKPGSSFMDWLRLTYNQLIE